MKSDTILKLVQQHIEAAEQVKDFATPLDYYLGNERGDEEEGRSQVISTDVADAIEWIMPQIMRSFTQNNEIVIFDPINADDDFQAKLESQYVYEVLMKENDGFITLYTVVKDSLIHQNGYIKVWYEEQPRTTSKTFTGLLPEQFQAFASNPLLTISRRKEFTTIGENGQPINYVNARISYQEIDGRIRVEAVAPEDIIVNSDHNSVNLDKAKFVGHFMTKTISELREDGVSEKIIGKLIDVADSDGNDRSRYRFSAQNESQNDPDTDDDDASLEVDICECYMVADLNGDGIAEKVKITVGGEESSFTVLIDHEEIDYSPWVSISPILMPHKLHGLSIYNRLKEIQDQKTALLRNTLDNIYLQNNQRHVIVEGQVKMSDLMVSRPGGVIRVKRADAIVPLQTPPVGQDAFNMMNYLDQIRAGRSGVSPEGELKQHNIGERVGSQGLERLLTAKEELVGLIVRVIAEVGIKPLCFKIRDLCTEHLDSIKDFRFRGQWLKVSPATWPNRIRTTTRVGTGTGNHERKVMAIREITQHQLALQQMPGQSLVDSNNIFKSLDDFCVFSGLNSAVGYFIDPNSPEGQQKAQEVAQQMQAQQQAQQEQMMEQLKFQKQLAEAEQQKAIAQSKAAHYRAQSDKANAMLQLTDNQNRFQLETMRRSLDEVKAAAQANIDDLRLDLDRDKLELEKLKLAIDTGLKVTELEMQKETEEDQRVLENAKLAQQAESANTAAAGERAN